MRIGDIGVRRAESCWTDTNLAMESALIPQKYNYSEIPKKEVSKGLFNTLKRRADKLSELREAHEELRKETLLALEPYRSPKKLLEDWPKAKAILKEMDFDDHCTAVARRFTDLDKKVEDSLAKADD